MCLKILLFLSLVLPTYMYAQTIISGDFSNNAKLKNPEPVIGRVLYDFSYVSDTTKPDTPKKEILILDFSKNYSSFSSQTFATSDSIMKDDINKQIKEQLAAGSDNLSLTSHFSREGSEDIFLTNSKTGEVSEQKNYLGKIFLIKDATPKIDWYIKDSTKTIGGYSCQQAIGNSKGRKYIVWFTTDLPYSYGPRRLNGLPGLILEAYDESKRIVYTFNQYSNSVSKEVGLPEQGIAATQKEFDEMKKAGLKENALGVTGSMRGSNPNNSPMDKSISKIKSISILKAPSSSTKKKEVINFPIDLIN